ncbi:MAG: trimethylamine methyltransferase family protein [Proteobacteria bacterium]|nr:trimethylamine methyltransferase family protein [Pseudomonadota bacterium]
MSLDQTPRRRRRRKQENHNKVTGCQAPVRQLVNPFRPIEILSEDQLESVHQASLTILRDTGIDFFLPEACDRLKKAGAIVEPGSTRVRFDPHMVESFIGLAPEVVEVHARNPERSFKLGERYISFGNVSSPPNVSDTINGRRSGNHIDFRNFLRLSQYYNIITFIGGYGVEPTDWHPSIRHLKATQDFIKFTDKAYHAYSLGRQRNLDVIEMTRIARGLDQAQMQSQTSLMTVINSNSPLQLDKVMLEGIIEMSSRNQLVILTPFTLAGAMAPITLAGALALQNAEALAGLIFTQVVKPGAPFVYGGFTSNVDMHSGSPAFGTPEYMKTAVAGGQLARRYKLPYRSSNVCAANAVDSQSAYESVFSLWGAVMGGANLVKHAAGWMEGGLCASFEKFVIDIDNLQMLASFFKPIRVDEDELAIKTIAEVGPGGHFFATEHTKARYRDAFYAPIISDWRNFETWQEAGSPTAVDKARDVFQQVLAGYEPPPLDQAIAEELDEFVERRIREGGVKTDF